MPLFGVWVTLMVIDVYLPRDSFVTSHTADVSTKWNPPLSVDSPTQIIVVKYSSTQIHSQSPSPSPYKPLYTHSTQYKHLNKTFCPDWVAAFSSKWRHNPPANQKKTIRLTPLGHPAVPANQATSAIPPTMCPSPNICNLPRLGVGVGVLGVCP